jgi:hypothetical protein
MKDNIIDFNSRKKPKAQLKDCFQSLRLSIIYK